MPQYEFTCQKCGEVEDHIVHLSERDQPLEHEGCGGSMVRNPVSLFQQGKESFQSGAILADGSKVKGHFGKMAPWKRRKKG